MAIKMVERVNGHFWKMAGSIETEFGLSRQLFTYATYIRYPMLPLL